MEEKQDSISTTQEMTAGEMLRAARTTGRRKREISTISKMLCIKEEFLNALEEGNYRVIPEDVYILGFARSYAVELGLNPDEIIAKLKHELGLLAEEEKEEEKKEESVEEPEEVEEIATPKAKESAKNKNLVWIIAGATMFVVIAVVSMILIFGKSSTGATAVNTDNSQEVIEQEPVKKEIAFKIPVKEVYTTPKKFDISDARVAFQAIDVEDNVGSYIQIKDSKDTVVYARVLAPGEVFYVDPDTKYEALFGNVGALDIWVDGQLINKLGKKGERKGRVSLSPDALKAYGLAE